MQRSFALLGSFKYEQPEPARFYRPLAEDIAQLIGALALDTAGLPLDGARILDVGGGPGYFLDAFASRGAWYVGLEPDAGEMSAAGITVANAVRGSGAALPFADGTFDVTYSSNVAEHIPNFAAMGDEMVRVTRPGGLVVLSYTVWLGPFGGHETGVWQHYVGGEFARRRYERTHGHAPKNVWGTSLFDVSCADGLAWARSLRRRGLADRVVAFPRYHPAWAWWLVRVPGVREAAVSNLMIAARRV